MAPGNGIPQEALNRLETQKELYARALRNTSNELEARIEELGLVRQLGRLFERSTRLEDVSSQALELFLRSSRAENTSILLLSENDRELTLLAAVGRNEASVTYYGPDAYPRQILTPGEGLAYACLEAGDPIFVEETRLDPRFASAGDRAPIGCLACIPLSVHDQPVGVVNLSHPEPRGLDASRMPVWTILASYLAIAISHAKLFSRLKASNRSLFERVQARTSSLEQANLELCEAKDEIRRQNEELQDRVRQRTLDLETALEELQAHHDQLEEANQVKDEFLNNINHELKTPLNAVIGYAGLVLKGSSGPLTDAQRSDLQLIEANGKHLQQILENIFSLKDIETGSVEPDLEPADLNDLIAEAVASVRPRAREKGLGIIFEPLDIPPVMIDCTLIRRVLFNLLDNAIKFSTRGDISVVSRIAHRNPERPQEETPPEDTGVPFAIVQVSDHGKGIEPAEIEQIFQKFHQVEPATRKSEGGSGVGLTIAKNLIELHGGRIWVTSRPGAGSTFAFCLPLDRKAGR